MLVELSSNKSAFKTVKFKKGFNVILADCKDISESSNDKETRNGVGKSTIVELIHFCLGASFDKTLFHSADFFESSSFSLTIDIKDKRYVFTRYVSDYGKIFISGDTSSWECEIKQEKSSQKNYLSIREFTNCMARVLFGVTVDKNKSVPSFRELISYALRRSTGYKDSFIFFDNQTAISKQLCNAYFLFLNLEYVSEFKDIQGKEKGIEAYKTTLNSGILGTTALTVGALNSEIQSMGSEVNELTQQLNEFTVHPQYNQISNEASELTIKIHELTNELIADKKLIEFYIKNIHTESVSEDIQSIQSMYSEAEVLFQEKILQKVEEVIKFHKAISSNRKKYLQEEIAKIEEDTHSLEERIQSMSIERQGLMQILKTQKALDEYILLQERLNKKISYLESLKCEVNLLEGWQTKKSQLKIQKEELLLKTRKDYQERLPHINTMQNIFSENSRALYASHNGRLLIDVGNNGYVFDIDIQGKKSQGITYMQIFCYDLLLMKTFSMHEAFPDFWLHDSTIFDGVDERQVANAIRLVYDYVESNNQQYICLINSDKAPVALFGESFKKKFDDSIILRLNDSDDDGKLFGASF